MVLASYHQQVTDSVILVWPTRRAGNNDRTEPDLQQVSGLIDQLIADFRVDTNRVWIAGGSEGVHAAWDLVVDAHPGGIEWQPGYPCSGAMERTTRSNASEPCCDSGGSPFERTFREPDRVLCPS